MGIGGIGFQPYIYSTNRISPASMNRVKPVEDDVTESSTDYSSLTDMSKNINPLHKGESANFVDILESQMAMSRANQARVMMPSGEGIFE